MRPWAPAAAVVLLGLAFGLSVLFGFRAQVGYRINGDWMAPAVPVGTEARVVELPGEEVRRGDVVVFSPVGWHTVGTPPWPDGMLMARVIGVGGDTVAIDGSGRLSVDGRVVDEAYTVGTSPADATNFSVRVDPGTVFLAGDARDRSVDSRQFAQDPGHGGVATRDVKGVVVAVDGRRLRPTTAFTNAGFDGVPYAEGDWRFRTDLWWLAVAGGALVVAGVVWLVAVLRRTGVPAVDRRGAVAEEFLR